jgi:hypothetical protein
VGEEEILGYRKKNTIDYNELRERRKRSNSLRREKGTKGVYIFNVKLLTKE